MKETDINKPITSFGELYNISSRIGELEIEIEKLYALERNNKNLSEMELINNKFKKILLNEERNALIIKLQQGIVLDRNIIKEKEEIIEMISSFLEPFGYSKEKIKEILRKIDFFVSNIGIAFSGTFVCFGNHVGIDYNYVEFDENGKVIGLKSENKRFLMYTLTHEFLHKCSVFGEDNNRITMTQDPFSEGFTDMFAQMITGYNEDVSKRYDFSVKICRMFTEIMGLENAIKDYISDINELKNLREMLKKYGLTDDDFNIFFRYFNEALALRCKKPSKTEEINEEEINEEEINEEEIECLNFLIKRIITPYCLDNPTKEEYILYKFYEYFPQYSGLDTNLAKSR